MKCPFCIKICTQCKRLLVANKINFTGHKNMKYGVNSKCKVCENENRRKNITMIQIIKKTYQS